MKSERRDRIVHSMLCNSDEATIVETVILDSTGQAHVVWMCMSCKHTEPTTSRNEQS